MSPDDAFAMPRDAAGQLKPALASRGIRRQSKMYHGDMPLLAALDFATAGARPPCGDYFCSLVIFTISRPGGANALIALAFLIDGIVSISVPNLVV